MTVPEVTIDENSQALSRDDNIGSSREGWVAGAERSKACTTKRRPENFFRSGVSAADALHYFRNQGWGARWGWRSWAHWQSCHCVNGKISIYSVVSCSARQAGSIRSKLLSYPDPFGGPGGSFVGSRSRCVRLRFLWMTNQKAGSSPGLGPGSE
jgi:hypothetical protein